MQYRPPNVNQEISNTNHFGLVSDSLKAAANECMASFTKSTDSVIPSYTLWGKKGCTRNSTLFLTGCSLPVLPVYLPTPGQQYIDLTPEVILKSLMTGLLKKSLMTGLLISLPVSFVGDTKRHRSLLSGVYARGAKRSHQSALECVTVLDSTTLREGQL